MIEALFNQSQYVAAKRMMDFTALRHEAVASNLANLETPNYKRVDVAPVFRTELQQAIAAGETKRVRSLRPQLQVDPTATARNRDGNTVRFEEELTQFNQNVLEHSVETHMVTNALLKLRLAITGRPF